MPQYTLTETDKTVLRLAGAGYADEQIGNDIGLSADVARYRMRQIILKLNARNRTHAVIIALRRGIIRLEDIP